MGCTKSWSKACPRHLLTTGRLDTLVKKANGEAPLMAKYSYLELAVDVLNDAHQPLTYQEIWQAAVDRGLTEKLRTTGKTPWQTLGAQLYVEVRDNAERSKFVGVGRRPVRFFLRRRQEELPSDTLERIETEETRQTVPQGSYSERDLHPLLTYFAYANPAFNRGRSIYTKTIFHEKSQKSGYNEWIHPDMVGFYLPLGDWQEKVIEFNRLSENNLLRLFSFELKKSLTKATYREAFFQAVSNSSWAHEGYLVAAEITQDDELFSELERLSSSFGIGIIHLDPYDIDGSAVLYPAQDKSHLDWEAMNKLCEKTPDFEQFLQDVKIDLESKRIHRAEYDDLLKDVHKYIHDKLRINTAT